MKSVDPATYVLKSCLSRTVFNLISNVDDNLDEILRRIDERYGKPPKPTDVIMNDIKRFRRIIESVYKQFTKFVNLVEKSCPDLEQIKMEREISNLHTVSLIEEKRPGNISWK